MNWYELSFEATPRQFCFSRYLSSGVPSGPVIARGLIFGRAPCPSWPKKTPPLHKDIGYERKDGSKATQ